MAMRVIRWIAFAPLALVAGSLAGAVVALIGEFFARGPNWYTWLVSGVAAAAACCWVAFRVAPSVSASVKWTVIAVVGGVGLLAVVQPLRDGNGWRVFQGLGMLIMAAAYARQSPAKLRADVSGGTGRATKVAD